MIGLDRKRVGCLGSLRLRSHPVSATLRRRLQSRGLCDRTCEKEASMISPTRSESILFRLFLPDKIGITSRVYISESLLGIGRIEAGRRSWCPCRKALALLGRRPVVVALLGWRS